MKRTILAVLAVAATSLFAQTPIPPGQSSRPVDGGAAFGFYAFQNNDRMFLGKVGTDPSPGYKHTWIQIGNGRYIFTTERIAGGGPVTPIRFTQQFRDTDFQATVSITPRMIIPGRAPVDSPMVVVPVVNYLCP